LKVGHDDAMPAPPARASGRWRRYAVRPCPPPDRQPRAPRELPPAGSIDCHAHVFGPVEHFPLAADRVYTPEACTFEQYRSLRAALGVDRAVILQPSAYGTDNAAMLDAMARGEGRLRGIAVIDERTTDAQCGALARHGVRGIRLTGAHGRAIDHAGIARAVARIAPLGWMLDLLMGQPSDLIELAPAIERSPVPVVLDHMGSCKGRDGVGAAPFAALRALLVAHDHVWVKISSFYRRSGEASPYADMRPLVEALALARPDRLVWGTNWPHTSWTGPMPNDGDLLDIFMGWVDDPALRERIMVRNPEALFGFEPWRKAGQPAVPE
jgi:predicted TIM-barrel fold metal-dependent hydrolase